MGDTKRAQSDVVEGFTEANVCWTGRVVASWSPPDPTTIPPRSMAAVPLAQLRIDLPGHRCAFCDSSDNPEQKTSERDRG